MQRINPIKYDKIAREFFSQVYPVIAEQIVEKTGIREGICLDVGTGGGYLAIALAKITNLSIYALDCSQEMLSIASKNIFQEGLEERIRILQGDVHQIPLDDFSVDLVVSRGSYRFWEDQRRAFKEIYRVLARGGKGYIGGGFGSNELKEKIMSEMRSKNPEWCKEMEERQSTDLHALEKNLLEAGISAYEITRDGSGLWVKIWKK